MPPALVILVSPNFAVPPNEPPKNRFPFPSQSISTLLQEATGASASALFVGTVGRLAHEKDQATFLRILANVRRVRRDVHGVVVGNGELRSALERLGRAVLAKRPGDR